MKAAAGNSKKRHPQLQGAFSLPKPRYYLSKTIFFDSTTPPAASR